MTTTSLTSIFKIPILEVVPKSHCSVYLMRNKMYKLKGAEKLLQLKISPLLEGKSYSDPFDKDEMENSEIPGTEPGQSDLLSRKT